MSKAVSRTETTTETNHTVTVELKTSGIRRDDDPNAKENLKGFIPLLVLALILGLLPVLLIIYWTFNYAGGLGFTVRNVFNWHPILLSISFIYLTGSGILTFRILRNLPKNTLKLIHASVKGVNCVLAVIGVWAAFNFHAKANIPDLYTMHSWIGMLTLVVYIAQAFAGLYAFLYPGIQTSSRATLMPYHRFAGQVLLALSIMCAVTGINEKAIFKLQNAYGEKIFEGNLLNMCGILFTLFGIVVIYISSNLDYKRYPRFEDTVPDRNK
ncbi:transmembrane ascorbate-dependent reductase CYB561-like isoform X1 [Planococcus citri]|uniref:transmembrane ascorbate-dependent reductase CYB561-like isoform X1 n=1 Tax=Planococcus citri TaxID=170843 RepID=UPI0031F80951